MLKTAVNKLILSLGWLLLLGFNSLLLLLFLLLALLGTEAGNRLLLNVSQSFIDVDYQSLDGNLLNQLRLNGLHVQVADTDIQIDQFRWNIDLAKLWGGPEQRRIHIRELAALNARVVLPPSAEKTDSEEKPTFKPQAIRLPLGLQLDKLLLDGLELIQSDQHYRLQRLEATLAVNQQASSVLQAQLQNGPYDSNADLTLLFSMNQEQLQLDVSALNASARFNEQDIHAQGQAQAKGSLLTNGELAWTLATPGIKARYGDNSLNVHGHFGPKGQLKLAVNAPKLQQVLPDLGGQALIHARIDELERIDLRLEAEQITWQDQTQLTQGQLHWRGKLDNQRLSGSVKLPTLHNQAVNLDAQFGWASDWSSLLQLFQQAPLKWVEAKNLHFNARANIDQQTTLDIRSQLGKQWQVSVDAKVPNFTQLLPDLAGQASLQATLKQADSIDLQLNASKLVYQNKNYLQQGRISWQGSLASSQLNADLALQQFQNRPLRLDSTFGWRGDWASLIEATKKPPLTLLSAPQLHLQANALLDQQTQVAINGTFGPDWHIKAKAQLPDFQQLLPDLKGRAFLDADIHNSKQITLKLNAEDILWLNQPTLTSAQINWQGDLANQQLAATLQLPQLQGQPLQISSQLGWRGDWPSLTDRLQQTDTPLLLSPELHFQAGISLEQAEIEATGVIAKNNQVSLKLDAPGTISVSGHSESQNGHIDIDGNARFSQELLQSLQAELQLSGERYTISNTPELKLSASPNIQASINQQLLKVRGQVLVDRGDIAIIVPKAGAITPSGDVEIIDSSVPNNQQEQTENDGLERDIKITLVIKDPISITGMGFDGGAEGKLTITESSGSVPTARGDLRLSGRYKAYGQDLTIRTGKLIYVDSPLDNPGVNLEAIRTVQEQIAGVRVTGPANNPTIAVFAEPALSETEALSYLLLGRGLDTSSEQDQRRLQSLALSLGLARSGKFLGRYKDKLGVDELSVQAGESDTDASLLLGRQISERLYVSTQIGLFEPITKLLLRYQVSRRCELVAETGTQQGADIVCSFQSWAQKKDQPDNNK